MEQLEKKEFAPFGFFKRVKSMLTVDFRRLLTRPFFYLTVGACVVIPILILVMTTMMDGTVSVDPQTGKETVMEGFDNVWQILGSVSGAAMDMSLTGMCNINMAYFFIAVLVCVFVADDFRSGYAKNLFTVRAKKGDYVLSKTVIGVFGSGCMLIAFFVGGMLGGAFSGLPFALDGVSVMNVVCCMLAKLALVGVFVPIYVLMSVIAKQRSWLSLILSFGAGMLLFTMAPIITPLNATFVNVILCVVGGVLFSVGLGVVSNLVLRKTSLV
ncbi:MAG: ABC transporter permease [Clostridia bacterium]|nr:ABC transporter permease [Clostridia bacterium]